MRHQMGDHRKANLCAVGSDEDVFVDKKMPIANSTSRWSLISSKGTLIMLCTMGGHRKANLCAVGSDEDVFVDKKMSIANSTSRWSLIGSKDTLIMLCCTTRLPSCCSSSSLYHPSFSEQSVPNYLAAFTSLSVTSQPRTPHLLTIALKSAVKGEIIFLNNSLA